MYRTRRWKYSGCGCYCRLSLSLRSNTSLRTNIAPMKGQAASDQDVRFEKIYVNRKALQKHEYNIVRLSPILICNYTAKYLFFFLRWIRMFIVNDSIFSFIGSLIKTNAQKIIMVRLYSLNARSSVARLQDILWQDQNCCLTVDRVCAVIQHIPVGSPSTK